jgi:hypothetical protein
MLTVISSFFIFFIFYFNGFDEGFLWFRALMMPRVHYPPPVLFATDEHGTECLVPPVQL